MTAAALVLVLVCALALLVVGWSKLPMQRTNGSRLWQAGQVVAAPQKAT